MNDLIFFKKRFLKEIVFKWSFDVTFLLISLSSPTDKWLWTKWPFRSVFRAHASQIGDSNACKTYSKDQNYAIVAYNQIPPNIKRRWIDGWAAKERELCCSKSAFWKVRQIIMFLPNNNIAQKAYLNIFFSFSEMSDSTIS